MATTKILPMMQSSSGQDDSCKCGEPDCVGHEVVDTQTSLGLEKIVQVPGFTSRKVRERTSNLVVLFDEPVRPSLSWAGECDLVVEQVGDDPHHAQFPYRWVLRG